MPKSRQALPGDNLQECAFIIQWISHRFDQEELKPTAAVFSETVARAIDALGDRTQAHIAARFSWRKIQAQWAEVWMLLGNGQLKETDDRIASLINETNDWIDQEFPAAGSPGAGKERAKLFTALRQRRFYEKNEKNQSIIHVNISGDLLDALKGQHEIPETSFQDFVRASLKYVLDTPGAITAVKKLTEKKGKKTMNELELLEAICKGIDPRTGEILDTPHNPDLDKKRLAYLDALRQALKPITSDANSPINQGKPWTQKDDIRLRSMWLSTQQNTAKSIGDQFMRSEGAIIARLVKIGLYTDRDAAIDANKKRG